MRHNLYDKPQMTNESEPDSQFFEQKLYGVLKAVVSDTIAESFYGVGNKSKYKTETIGKRAFYFVQFGFKLMYLQSGVLSP